MQPGTLTHPTALVGADKYNFSRDGNANQYFVESCVLRDSFPNIASNL